MLTDDEVLAIYDEAGATWFFDYRRGVPGAPHAILTSGKHSDGYVDSRKVLSRPHLTTKLIYELVRRLYKRNVLVELVDVIVSSTYSAVPFGYELARQLNYVGQVRARFEYVEKNPAFETDKTAPRFFCKFTVAEGEHVLQAEELITTLETTIAVRRAVEVENPHGRIRWNPDIACGILRPDSDRSLMATGDIICLAKKVVKAWSSEECILCKQGSPALKPKSHWAELTGKAT
ncbi:MAG: hypothetical protein HYT40_03210 [Candidatus Sungbacteria bacterium]|uniref:Orotate phosphoribosyltransferase n=1 Tax=Candidatus Sungiibacteriota bacterium TaxID=2750080 RepID=A0A931SDY8_9BACT|nr:hypothetical protein [Candidatus Sungbacteria bacterium]